MKRKIKIMGILNVTPDSFYDRGAYFNSDKAIERAAKMINEGVDIIDVGGESTRPGSKLVPADEEINRVCPVIEAISAETDIPISVDTNKSQVAAAALKAGASIINDISGLTFDDKMVKVVADYNAGVVLMHIKGKPEDMQDRPEYNNLIEEIIIFLKNACEKAIAGGIDPNKIIIDPGVGFGKTLEDNYRIINNIDRFKQTGFSVLVGLSRKSLIGKLYDKDVDRLPATIALNTVSIINGADIIRVHDVREHRLVLDSLAKLYEQT